MRLVVLPDHGELLPEFVSEAACGVNVAPRDGHGFGLRHGGAHRIGVSLRAVLPDFGRQGAVHVLAAGDVETAVRGRNRIEIGAARSRCDGVFQGAVHPDFADDRVALLLVARGVDRAVIHEDGVGPGVVRAVGQGVELAAVFPDRRHGLSGRGFVAGRVDVVARGFRPAVVVVVAACSRAEGRCEQRQEEVV